MSEFLGVTLFATALVWLIALVTYNAADPVWFFNTGGQAPPPTLSVASARSYPSCLFRRWATRPT